MSHGSHISKTQMIVAAFLTSATARQARARAIQRSWPCVLSQRCSLTRTTLVNLSGALCISTLEERCIGLRKFSERRMEQLFWLFANCGVRCIAISGVRHFRSLTCSILTWVWKRGLTRHNCFGAARLVQETLGWENHCAQYCAKLGRTC